MARRRSKVRRQGRRARWLPYLIAVGVAAVVAAALILAGALGGGGGGGGPLVLPSPRPGDIPRDDHLLGTADAPVKVVEYLDFQ